MALLFISHVFKILLKFKYISIINSVLKYQKQTYLIYWIVVIIELLLLNYQTFTLLYYILLGGLFCNKESGL